MDLQLKDKVVLITGGAKGIGAAIMRGCAREGAIPVFVDKDERAGKELESELQKGGARCELICADLLRVESCSAAVEETLRKFGRLDVLVNNVGVNDNVGLEHGSPEKYLRSLELNLLHYYNMAHYALPALKNAQGCIVNIASKVAMTGQGGTSGYASAKGAILSLTREWAAELLPYGIRVNAIDCSGGSGHAALQTMAQHISESRGKTKADCFKNSAGEENDTAGGNCGDGFVSYFGAGEPYHRAARSSGWRLCASRSRFDVRKDSDSEWRKDRRSAHEIQSHPAAGLAGGDRSVAGHASGFGKCRTDVFRR